MSFGLNELNIYCLKGILILYVKAKPCSGKLLIETLGTNFSEILIEIQIFSFKKMGLKMSSAKWQPFCLGLNVLRCNTFLYMSWQHSNHWNTSGNCIKFRILAELIIVVWFVWYLHYKLCGWLVPYGDIHMCKYRLLLWLLPWWYRTPPWANVDFSTVRFCGIHHIEILQRVHEIVFCIMSLKVILWITVERILKLCLGQDSSQFSHMLYIKCNGRHHFLTWVTHVDCNFLSGCPGVSCD